MKIILLHLKIDSYILHFSISTAIFKIICLPLSGKLWSSRVCQERSLQLDVQV